MRSIKIGGQLATLSDCRDIAAGYAVLIDDACRRGSARSPRRDTRSSEIIAARTFRAPPPPPPPPPLPPPPLAYPPPPPPQREPPSEPTRAMPS